MLFRRQFLEGIRNGTVTLAFRRWRRPTVRSGGTLLTAVGQLGIDSVRPVRLEEISSADARRAGYASLEELRSELERRQEGEVYRIELGALSPDPRIALRNSPAEDASEARRIGERLRRLDAAADGGPWTLRVLELLDAHPAVRAGDLSPRVAQSKEQFKMNVRKLKNLGLTVSLGTGYRLSPRGAALLPYLRSVRRPG